MSVEKSNSEKTVVQLMDEYVALVHGGKSKKEAAEKMMANGVSKSTMRKVRNSVDDLNLLIEPIKAQEESPARLQWIGIFLVCIGLAITIYSFMRTEERGWGLYVIMYGPILSGLSLISASRRKLRRNSRGKLSQTKQRLR